MSRRGLAATVAAVVAAAVVAVAAVVVTAAGTTDAIARPRSRKIVRVERPRTGANVPVRIFPAIPGHDMFTEYGERPPEPGTIVSIVTPDGVVGVGRVVRSAPKDTGCDAATWHEVEYRLDSAQPAPRVGYLETFAVQGVALDATRARLVVDLSQVGHPSGRADERVWAGIDTDGDGRAEILATSYDCASSDGAPSGPSGQPPRATCIDTWTRDASTWRRANQDRFYTCF